jgi:hypothetical protein
VHDADTYSWDQSCVDAAEFILAFDVRSMKKSNTVAIVLRPVHRQDPDWQDRTETVPFSAG